MTQHSKYELCKNYNVEEVISFDDLVVYKLIKDVSEKIKDMPESSQYQRQYSNLYFNGTLQLTSIDDNNILISNGKKTPFIILNITDEYVLTYKGSVNTTKDILSSVNLWIQNNNDFDHFINFTCKKESMSRDQMINYMNQYPFIPFTHPYFEHGSYIYSDGIVIKDEDDVEFENWISTEENLYSTFSRKSIDGLRKRVGECWDDGWRVYTNQLSTKLEQAVKLIEEKKLFKNCIRKD